MIRKILVLVFLLLAAVQVQAQEEEELIFHQVKRGETKYGISREYHISIQRLEQFNPEIKAGLNVGMKLLIPAPLKADSIAIASKNDTSVIEHPVKKGDTFYSLAREYGVSIAEIKAENDGLPAGLRIGELIYIPRKDTNELGGQMLDNYYVIEVKPKQTAYSISREYDISLDSLYILNPGIENGLQIGQMVRMPKNRKPEVVKVLEKKPQETLNSDRPEPKADTTSGYILYQVKTGDSFYSLKQRYRISQTELLELNPELSAGLKVGNYIIIPRQREEKEPSNFFEKLFRQVEASEELPPVSKEKKEKKDSLNNIGIISEEQIAVIEDTIEVDINKNYRVAVMLPFFARPDTTVPQRVSDRSKIALEFYNGLLMAADTLSNDGMNLTLNVFDTENSRYKLNRLIPEVRRGQYDLVIGPLYRENVELVADKLRKEKILVISPLSKAVSVEGRPNLVNARQDRSANAQRVAEILNEYYLDYNVVFAINGEEGAYELEQQIKSRLSPRPTGAYVKNAISAPDMPISRVDLEGALSEERPNVVVVFTEDQVFLTGLVNNLRLLRSFDISLVGPAKLMQIETLDLNYLNDLKLTMPDIHFADFQDSATVDFVRAYRKRFKAEPTNIAFQGYDVGRYFLGKLWTSGVYLPLTIQGDKTMLSTGFEMIQIPGGGFENTFMHVIGVRNLTLVKLDR